MSISTNKPENEDEKFADIVYAPHADSKQEEKDTPAPAEETTKAPTEGQADDKAEEKKKQGKKSSYWMDIALVSTLVVILGVGCYFIKTQMERYDVPTPYEEACAEYDRLSAEFNHIISNRSQVNNIQRVKTLQGRITALETEIEQATASLNKAREKKAGITSSIAQEKQAIDSARYNLRESDRDYRAKAMAELPGLPVGNVINRQRNSVFNDAIIYTVDMQARRIHFRSTSGQVNWLIKDISKKELPPIVRYALNLADLVDMSVLDEEGKPEGKKRPVARRETPHLTTTESTDSYDPQPGAPVISSGHTETLSSEPTSTEEADQNEQPTWEAPTGDLPF